MKHVLLLQLPIPQLNFGRQTLNIPLGAAWLKQTCGILSGVHIEVVPESVASYLADEALLRYVLAKQPDIIGFTVYTWNLRRSLYMARQIKAVHNAKIIFGGPEITPDNPLDDSGNIDFLVYGEGEAVLMKLLQDPAFWQEKQASITAGDIFRSGLSPYMADFLEPGIANTMLLETQRGCPYRCRYCYYNKSSFRVAYADRGNVLKAVKWALEHQLGELYLLDPSLDARSDLKALLKDLGHINQNKSLSIMSEIRADRIDPRHAELMASAGFYWFEVGLQSTNQEALALINRPTDLGRFLQGTGFLQQQGIKLGVDLIAGLPGDGLQSFKDTVDFVVRHNLFDDIQVFPLSLLPGTDLRRHSAEMGLQFDPSPPYMITETPLLSAADILECIDYAEAVFDVALYPLPDLNISWQLETNAAGLTPSDRWVRIGMQRYISKLWMTSPRNFDDLRQSAARLTHPYQVFIGPGVSDQDYICKVLNILSSVNPFTPFEVVFFEPETTPDTAALLSAIKLDRPHYLDNDLRFLFARPGNRAVIFTLVSSRRQSRFSGDMKRWIYWWKDRNPPELKTLQAFDQVDGILIDPPVSREKLIKWQDHLAGRADELVLISFADEGLQRRWLKLTAAEDYYLKYFFED